MSLNFEGKAPDLVFYVSVKSGEVQQQEVGFLTLRQNRRPITSDKEGKHEIGLYVTDGTIVKISDKEAEFALNNLSINLFNLGTFVAESSGDKLVLDDKGNYIVKTNSVKTITSGNENFLGAKGYMVFIRDETPVITILVYFTHV